MIITSLDQLKSALEEDVKHLLSIHLISFGWTPVIGGAQDLPKANVYLDCRAIPNPHHVPGLVGKGGDHPDVINFVRTSASSTERFVEEIEEAIARLPVRRRDKEDPYADPLIVACGCAWGVHRSVAMKIILAERLRERGWIFVEVK